MNPLERGVKAALAKAHDHYCERYELMAVDATPTHEVRGLIKRLRPVRGPQELIRIGPDRDAGYLVPDDLDGVAACFSPGVDVKSDFEWECAQRGMDVFMADRSVERPARSHERFHFTRKYLGSHRDETYTTLEQWVGQCCPDTANDLILQMDIEGYEYEVMYSTPPEVLERFRVIVIELHDLHHLWDHAWFRLAARAIEKLLRSHTVVHLHPNNRRPMTCRKGVGVPRLLEVTLLRNDRITTSQPVTRLPHPLDADCVPERPTVALPACWYAPAS